MIMQINNLSETIKFFGNYQGEINRTMKTEAIHEIAKNLQRRIKRRAPKGPTGYLRRSVMIEKDGNIRRVVVNASYAWAIEFGRGPNKGSGSYMIPIEFLEQHNTRPDSPGEWVDNPKGFVDLRSSIATKPRPFIRPAIASWRPQINRLLSHYIDKTLSKSGGIK
ncbi:MAG: HK97 gp10 family phage protein [bacterium]